MVEKKKELKTKNIKSYRRNYYLKHKDHVREYQKKHKDRIREYNKNWRIKNGWVASKKEPFDLIKYRKEYYQKNKEKLKAYSLKLYIRDREKWRARKLAQYHVKIPKGQLCELCKVNQATERHHKDYSKPYIVLFVCKECHEKIH